MWRIGRSESYFEARSLKSRSSFCRHRGFNSVVRLHYRVFHLRTIPLFQSSWATTPTSKRFPIMAVITKATIASFGGKMLKLSHSAKAVGCEMAFNLYLPPQATASPPKRVPLLIYLSGLTCTPENCSEKGFFQHGASKKGIAVLYPDTSPRACQTLDRLARGELKSK